MYNVQGKDVSVLKVRCFLCRYILCQPCLTYCGLDSGRFMKRIALIMAVLFAGTAYADLASVSYVNTAVETRVDTSAQAKQVMAGEYTVSGALNVPTPPLPPMD